MKQHGVYLHFKPGSMDITGCFYVGKGGVKRAFSSTNRNRFWHEVVSRCGAPEIVWMEHMSDKGALDEEIKIIADLRSYGIDLTNITSGGQGVTGLKRGPLSEEHKRAISVYQKGRPKSSETRQHMSNSRKGKKHTPETKAAIAKSHTGKKGSAHKRMLCAENMRARWASGSMENVRLKSIGRSLPEKAKKAISAALTGKECPAQKKISLSIVHRKNNTSGYAGVMFEKAKYKWTARITVAGKRIFLGAFNDLADAVSARKNAEVKYFGRMPS